MDTREVLLPKVLKQAGYYSGIFGKWDLGMHRDSCPWPEVGTSSTALSTPASTTTPTSRLRRAVHVSGQRADDRGQGRLLDRPVPPRGGSIHQETSTGPSSFTCLLTRSHGASSLDPVIRSRAPPENGRKMYPSCTPRSRIVDGTRYNRPAKVANRALRMTNYLGAVTAMDAAIGEVLDLLDQYELAGNTIVIFFSDNGGTGRRQLAPLGEGKVRSLRAACGCAASFAIRAEFAGHGQRRIPHVARAVPDACQAGRGGAAAGGRGSTVLT